MANASSQPSAPLAANSAGPGKDELLFSGDRKFAMHGEIMLLVLVLLFASFLIFIAYLLCKRRSNNSYSDDSPKLGQSEPTTPMNYSTSIAMFKVQFKDGLNAGIELDANYRGF